MGRVYNTPATLTGAVNDFLPRNEDDRANDVCWESLGLSGAAKLNAKLTSSMCGTFDGTDDYISIADNTDLDITDNLSVFFRAKNANAAIASSEYILSKWLSTGNKREWSVAFDTSEKMHFYVSGDGTASLYAITDAAITVDEWHDYCCTFENGVITLFVDGYEVASTTAGTATTTIYNDTQPMYIGAYNNGSPAAFYEGNICDVRVYSGTSAALTESQVAEAIAGTLTFTGQTLAAHYPLAEGLNPTAYDVSGNGNNGVITNADTTLGGLFWGTTQDVFHWNVNESA